MTLLRPALLFLLACSAQALAADEVDQQNLVIVPEGAILTGSGLAYQPNIAASRLGQMQSVTAGKQGILAGLDLQLFRVNTAQSDLPFSVSVVDGEPGTSGLINIVGTRNFTKQDLPLTTAAQSGSVLYVDVASFNYAVSPGQKFSILVSLPPREPSTIAGSITGPIWSVGYGIPVGDDGGLQETFLNYDRGFNTLISGNGYRQVSGVDRGFRTYVNVTAVPEPATWTMFLAGFGIAGAAARRGKVSITYA